MKSQRKKRNMVLMLFLAGVLATATFAFTAGNTFSGANVAGDGSDEVSGFAVSNISYTEDGVNDTLVGAVSFTLDSATDGTVKVAISDDPNVPGPVVWSALLPCVGDLAPAPSVNFTCALSSESMSIAAIENLRVVALG